RSSLSGRPADHAESRRQRLRSHRSELQERGHGSHDPEQHPGSAEEDQRRREVRPVLSGRLLRLRLPLLCAIRTFSTLYSLGTGLAKGIVATRAAPLSEVPKK